MSPGTGPRRGAPLAQLDDVTPLRGADVAVGVRIGWTLRMARLTAEVTAMRRLEDMAAELGTNVTRLHRLETGVFRDGSLVDAYERALGLPVGAVRAPVDVVCRTFPQSPPDRTPATTSLEVPAFSRLTEVVVDGAPDGGTWLAWARAMAHPGATGMPDWVARQALHRLAGELGRAVGPAYPSRYEALALVRCSGYGHLVLDVARERVADPDVQVLYDLASAVGEAVTPDAVAWSLELLDDPRPQVVVGGALALENMGQITEGDGFWRGVVEDLVTRFNDAGDGSTAWHWLSHLLRLVPSRVMAEAPVSPKRSPAPDADIPDWTRTRVNTHWSECQDRAHEVTAALGLADQPVLARFLFDIGVGPFESRSITSSMLLGALPAVAPLVGQQLAEMADEHPDEVIRARASRRLAGALHGAPNAVAAGWLSDDRPGLREHAARIAAAAGERPPDERLCAMVDLGGDARRAAMYAVGMGPHPLLDHTVRHHHDPAVRAAAAWWQREGSRVMDPR